MKVGNWRWVWGLSAAAMYLGAGCAQDVGDIDRTQPEKIEKSQFQNDDEWYYRQTVVDTDVQATAGYTGLFEAFEGSLYRVRWTITEDVLYAMSTVEPADGATAESTDPEGRRIGVVAAFPILQHFDVQRAYSSSTGEQTNVITENGSDKPWYERKYMRVDWSTNMAGTFSQIGPYLGTMAATGRNIPQEEGYINPNRTRFESLDSNPDNWEYIDTVTEYYFEPDLYACYTTLGYDSIFSCEGGPVHIRNSFKKIDPVKTYKPLDFTDNEYLEAEAGKRLYTMNVYDPTIGDWYEIECDENALASNRNEFGYAEDDACRPATYDLFTRFGYFRTERVAYDAGRGANYEELRSYYANRWNIWQSMFDEDGNDLDMADRVPKPIIYHTNLEFPPDMWDATQKVADQWNDAFLNTVAIAKGVSVADVETELMGLYGHDDMYRIERNNCSGEYLSEWMNVWAGEQDADRTSVKEILGEFKARWGEDLQAGFYASTHDRRHELCATLEWATEERASDNGRFSYQRVGDLRYSFFNWVDESVPWLGYGPSAADPLTGEIISGNANFAGRHLRTYGPAAADYVQYMNGELEEDEVIWGDHIYEYLQGVRNNMRTANQELTSEGKRELARRGGVMAMGADPAQFGEMPEWDEIPALFKARGKQGTMAIANRDALSMQMTSSTDTRAAEFYARPEVRQYLLQDNNFRLLVESTAIDRFGPQFNDDEFQQAYIDATAPGLAHDRYERRNAMFMGENIMLASNMENALTSLVTYSGVNDHFRGKSREEISRYFVDKMFIGTQLHEIGHTLGLRHNFGASTDVMNYHDEYWEIQKAIADGIINGDERWSIQGEKASQIAGKTVDYLNEAEYRLSSTMDYMGDMTGDFGGLAKYDRAAINFAYGEVVEQWKSDDQLSQEFGVNGLDSNYSLYQWLNDYTLLPQIMSGEYNWGDSLTDDAALIKKGIEVIQNGREWVPVSVAKRQRIEGIQTNTSNYRNGQFGPGTAPYFDRSVPYEFCSDDRRDYQLGCDVWDFGANQREIVNHQFNNYRLFQPFRRYSRGKINRGYENLSSYANWVYSAFKSAERPFRYYSIYQWWNLGAYTDDLREASIDAMNFYSEILAMPEPGRYCKFDPAEDEGYEEWYYDLQDIYVPDGWVDSAGRCNNSFDVPKGPGQFYNYDFTDEYDYRITRVGSYIDKLYATYAMFEISSNYINSSFFTDFRATNISYWTLFQDEMLAFLRALILEDFKGFGGVYNKQTGEYEPPVLIDAKTFGTGLPTGQDGMDRVRSTLSFGHQFNILVGGMLYNTTWQDRYVDFAQYMKIAVASDELQPFPEETVLAEFVHPITGQIYVAPETADNNSIAVDIIDWANSLRSRYVAAKEALDAAEPGTNNYEIAQRNFDVRSQQLEEVVAKMDMVRWIYEALGANGLR